MDSSKVEKTKKIITAITSKVRGIANELAILLVIKTKSKTNLKDDYKKFSILTEYFSDEELEEITSGIYDIGCFVDISYGEKEFIDKLEKGFFNKIDKKYKVVYNTVGSGLIRSRSALIPSLCELYNIRYCGNDIYTSALLENKVHTLNLLNYYGFRTPKYYIYDAKFGWLRNEKPGDDQLLISKPAHEYASIGINNDSVSYFNKKYFDFIVDQSINFNQQIIVQEFISGYEVEVPVFDIGEPFIPASNGIKINKVELLGNEFLTYERVFNDEYEFYSYDKFENSIASELKDIASNSFKILGLRGIIRVDFRITKDKIAYITDYNNNPHLTEFHSCSFAIQELGFRYSDMLCLVIYRGLMDILD